MILGSNLGDRELSLKRAAELIGLKTGTIIKSSSIYETEPWELSDNSKLNYQNSKLYLNQVLKIDTNHTPLELLSNLLDIENELGRKRKSNKQEIIKNKLITQNSDPQTNYEHPTIDIDILFYDNIILNPNTLSSQHLIIPHPLLHKRKFVLIPLCEIASDFIHPVFKKSIKQLLHECDDKNEVRKLS